MTSIANAKAAIIATVSAADFLPKLTQASIPTRTLIQTKHPIPSQKPLSMGTAPGTILQVKQAWQQGGWELVLSKATLGFDWLGTEPGIYVTFVLTNRNDRSAKIEYNLMQIFSAADNRGNQLDIVIGLGGAQDFFGSEIKSLIVPRGDSVYLSSYEENKHAPSVFIYADTTDPALTEVIVTSSVLDITNARWRIKIPH